MPLMGPLVGIEPTALRLQGGRSTGLSFRGVGGPGPARTGILGFRRALLFLLSFGTFGSGEGEPSPARAYSSTSSMAATSACGSRSRFFMSPRTVSENPAREATLRSGNWRVPDTEFRLKQITWGSHW